MSVPATEQARIEPGPAAERIRVLCFTTQYPNRTHPVSAVFVERRLQELIATGRVEARVVAPVPWFPAAAGVFGRYARLARVPRSEERLGTIVDHPRYPVVPKVGMQLAPRLMELATYRHVAALAAREPSFDLIDAHFFYPDGVVAARLGARLDKPVVITARGSDINLYTRFPRPRRLILEAALRADAVVTVCQDLKDRFVEMGIPADHVTVLRNGVDIGRFRPVDGAPVREALDIRGRMLLSVGRLVELKGNHLVIDALARLPECTFVLVGEGEERARLEQRARALGVHERVRFVGAVDNADFPGYYCAADALVLMSSREGWANVLLESMACGTPVLATAVGGSPEVVTRPEAGRLLAERSAECLVHACETLLGDYPDRAEVRRYASVFDWAQTSRGQLALFERVIAARAARRKMRAA